MKEQRKTCIMSEVMPPERANFSGHIHGGYIMLLMDRAAYACSARFSKKDVVTVSVDQVIFKEPIYVGELVTFAATVNYAGTTSLEVGIKVTAENVKTGVIRHTNSCYMNMVAIDEHGKPTAVPVLELITERDKRRFHEAEKRRLLHREQTQRHQDIKSKHS